MSLRSKWLALWRKLELAPPVRTMKRRVRQLTGTELRTFVEVRRTTAEYGDWRISVADIPRGGIAYSLGVGEDATLDRALIAVHGLEVHAFDPTPRAVAWVATQHFPPGFHFHPVGVAGYDGTAEFATFTNIKNPSFTMLQDSHQQHERVSCPVRKLSTLAHELQHTHIHLLKMDIEGAEYDVIEDLLSSQLVVDQLLVEFHHRFGGVGKERTAQAVAALKAAGYRIFNISPSGREYSFVRAPTTVSME